MAQDFNTNFQFLIPTWLLVLLSDPGPYEATERIKGKLQSSLEWTYWKIIGEKKHNWFQRNRTNPVCSVFGIQHHLLRTNTLQIPEKARFVILVLRRATNSTFVQVCSTVYLRYQLKIWTSQKRFKKCYVQIFFVTQWQKKNTKI